MVRMVFLVSLGVITFTVGAAMAAEAEATVIRLPEPVVTGGMPLMEALGRRRTTRQFDSRPVPDQELSNLLWAAYGVNRSDGRRTVPTSQNKQEMEVYAAMASGVWRYDGMANTLVLAAAVDAQAVFQAPLTLLYVAPEDHYAAGLHAGSSYQNVGLYCASAGLGNVVKRTGKDALDGILPLPPRHSVVIIQEIGYPAH